MYINGMENLLKYGKSHQLLRSILNPGLEFNIIIRELKETR